MKSIHSDEVATSPECLPAFALRQLAGAPATLSAVISED